MSKSEMLRRSMRCFNLGWWSLIPVIGVVPALFAFVEFNVVVARTGTRWNAARTRLVLGAWLASIGILLTIILGLLTIVAIFNSLSNGRGGGPSFGDM